MGSSCSSNVPRQRPNKHYDFLKPRWDSACCDVRCTGITCRCTDKTSRCTGTTYRCTGTTYRCTGASLDVLVQRLDALEHRCNVPRASPRCTGALARCSGAASQCTGASGEDVRKSRRDACAPRNSALPFTSPSRNRYEHIPDSTTGDRSPGSIRDRLQEAAHSARIHDRSGGREQARGEEDEGCGERKNTSIHGSLLGFRLRQGNGPRRDSSSDCAPETP